MPAASAGCGEHDRQGKDASGGHGWPEHTAKAVVLVPRVSRPPASATAVQAVGAAPPKGWPAASLGKVPLMWRPWGGSFPPWLRPVLAPPKTRMLPSGQRAVTLNDVAAPEGPMALLTTI